MCVCVVCVLCIEYKQKTNDDGESSTAQNSATRIAPPPPPPPPPPRAFPQLVIHVTCEMVPVNACRIHICSGGTTSGSFGFAGSTGAAGPCPMVDAGWP